MIIQHKMWKLTASQHIILTALVVLGLARTDQQYVDIDVVPLSGIINVAVYNEAAFSIKLKQITVSYHVQRSR